MHCKPQRSDLGVGSHGHECLDAREGHGGAVGLLVVAVEAFDAAAVEGRVEAQEVPELHRGHLRGGMIRSV